MLRTVPHPAGASRLSVEPSHRVRVGEGLDALDVSARGFGVLVGACGLRLVWRAWEGRVLRRFSTARPWVAFVGLHGVTLRRSRLPAPSELWLPPPPPPLLAPFVVPVRPPAALDLPEVTLRYDAALVPVPDQLSDEEIV